jgi:hypothetical protein
MPDWLSEHAASPPAFPCQLFLGDPAVTALVKAITSGGLINVG